jgi:hypothetical protein
MVRKPARDFLVSFLVLVLASCDQGEGTEDTSTTEDTATETLADPVEDPEPEPAEDPEPEMPVDPAEPFAVLELFTSEG